jgi:excisionase family DNA binding protein
MKDKQQSSRWLSVADACTYLSVSKGTLYTYMKDGRLPFYYLAGTHQRRVKQEELDALLVRGSPTDEDRETKEAL